MPKYKVQVTRSIVESIELEVEVDFLSEVEEEALVLASDNCCDWAENVSNAEVRCIQHVE